MPTEAPAPPRHDTAQLHDLLGDLVQASHRLTRLAAHATGNTESPAIWRTLSVLRTSGPVRLGELATLSRVSQPTMTKLVRNLAEREWVKRIADSDDARAWQIAATRKGLRAVDSWRDQLASALLPLFSELPESDVAALRRAITVISEKLELTDTTTAVIDISRLNAATDRRTDDN